MKEPIKILHVLGGLDLGGAETFVMSLYRCMDRSKVQFDFVVHTPNRCFYEDEITKLGGQVFRVPRFTGFNIFSYRKAWRQLFRKHPQYAAVHGHIGSSAAIYLQIAKQFHITTIAHSHGAGNTRDFKGFMYGVFSYPTRFIADWFFACSKLAGVSRFGNQVVSSDRFKVIRNAIDVGTFGYDPEKRKKTREALELDRQVVVGHVGRLDPLKNHLFLLEVFKRFHEIKPDSILLLIGDGEERSHIEHTVQRLELGDSVRLLGSISDVPELLMAMDVFVFPSLAEGLGISLIEAQATGLPCIASLAVPTEAKITDLVDFISLKDPIDRWVDAMISRLSHVERHERIVSLREHGYDVTASSREIQDFFLRLEQK